MIKNPKLPMHSDELPQQRVHLVVDLPPRPDSFHVQLVWIDEVPAELQSEKIPQNAEYLCLVEWTWSPANSRVDACYLSAKGHYWLLWHRYFDEFCGGWGEEWNLYAYGPKKNITTREAAVYLLMDTWIADKENQCLEAFHMISETGSLSVSDLEAIGRTVWPEQCDQKDG